MATRKKMTKVSKELDKKIAKDIKEGNGYKGLDLKEEKPKEKKAKEENDEVTFKSIIELIVIVIAVIVILIFFPHTVIWNIIVLLLMLSLLITVHEFGHFIVAKLFGVHVYEFAIGMGPKVLSFKRKNDPTVYSLRALPIGGFNQLAGEVGEDDDSLPKDKFMCNKPKWQRVLILCAGVTMNFLLALIFLFMLSCIWGSAEQRSIVAGIIPESGAEVAGITKGDKILKLNGHDASSVDALNIAGLLKNKNDYNTYIVEHKDGKRETYKVDMYEFVISNDTGSIVDKITKENTKENILKNASLKEEDVTVSKLAGLQFDNTPHKGFIHSLKYAGVKFVNTVKIMITIIVNLITGNLGMDALSGPVGMYTVIDQATNIGSKSYAFYNMIYLTAYISINLGVMNILPFPAFDGGQLLFVIYEAITRKKGNANVEGLINLIGFVLIFSLMIYITFKDVLKLIG